MICYCDTSECDEESCHRCYPRHGCQEHEKCMDYTLCGEGYTEALGGKLVHEFDLTDEFKAARAQAAEAAEDAKAIHCPQCQGTSFFVITKGEPLMHTSTRLFDFNKRYAYSQYECASLGCKHVVTTDNYDLWEALGECEKMSG